MEPRRHDVDEAGPRTHGSTWSSPRQDLYRLDSSTDIVTAGRFFGYGRERSYQLAKRGEFPVKVLRRGWEYRVITADLIARLDPAHLAMPGNGHTVSPGPPEVGEPDEAHAHHRLRAIVPGREGDHGGPADPGTPGAGELPPNVRAMLTPRLLGVLALAQKQDWRVSRFDVIGVVGGKTAADGCLYAWQRNGLIERVGTGQYVVIQEARELLAAGERGAER